MAECNEYFDYHLTPTGWVNGSSRINMEKIVEVPKDRLLSIRYTSYMRSSWSGSQDAVQLLYGDYNDPMVQKLRDKYGFWPNNDVEGATR
jgi:hypothetical protein